MIRELPALPATPLATEIRAAALRLRLRDRSSELDSQPSFPWPEFRALAEARLVGLYTPAALGGRGLSLSHVGAALFHLAYWGGTTFSKLSLQPEFSSVLAEHGSPELQLRFFQPLVRGEILVGNQVTEPAAGSDARAIELIADCDREMYVLNGTKTGIAFAADANVAIVYGRVRSDGKIQSGVTAFLVPQDLAGVSRTVAMDLGERWMRRGTVVYDSVRIPKQNRIGAEGQAFAYLKTELERERALLATIYLGVARASWEDTMRYVGVRSAFGSPLATRQAVSFPLVEDWCRLESAWLFVQAGLAELEMGKESAARSAMAKWFATSVALKALNHAIQFHGGRGYSKDLPHEQRWRDVRSGAIAHGPDEVMHMIACRHLWSQDSAGEADGSSAAPQRLNSSDQS
jgi:alkylation response protein AidB-like acyl-CoA dehydrogenase